MDIEILLFLQELRNSLGGYLDEIFNGFSKVSVVVMPLLPVVIYWCVSTKWGKRFMATICCGEVINGLIKLTVCAYRPWIRSELIEPAGDSKVAATGYSFPSGHTMNATATYGTLAVWQHKKRKWIAVTCGNLIFITMFSRLILGVHTPQDVLAGFAETSVIIFLMGIIIQ
ncbi:MAG: phosphatase PAP2 family protein [Erysipelotrichaceae bacterium]|nr:phosphatase PAP2 family protein [Erysipelotrichaceae bacterium]